MDKQEEIRAFGGLAEILYQSRHRWGDWNSLSENEKVKYTGAIKSVLIDGGLGYKMLLINALSISHFEQGFWNLLKPLRRFIIRVRQ